MAQDFITARDYQRTHAAMRVGDGTPATKQPDSTPPFRFGLQPTGLKDADVLADGKRRKIGLIGAGDLYGKFVGWALDHRGTDRYVYDPKRPIAPSALEHPVASLEDMPADIDYLVVCTPACYHADYIRWAQARGIPVMCEKPLVAESSEMTGEGGLDGLLKDSKSPVYAMDWEVLLATPLLTALGQNAPFADGVEFTNKDAFKSFDLGAVTHIEATFLEGGDNDLGDVAKAMRDRPWLGDIKKGGGAAFDMAVHALNTLAVMGFLPGAVQSAIFGDAIEGEKGVYRRIGNGEQTGETYVRAMMQTRRDGGPRIPTLIEAGKGGVDNDMRIKLVARDGKVIDWEYGRETSFVTLRDKEGNVLATASANMDPYALMFEQATQFFKAEKAKPGPKTALYYPEHRAVVESIEAMHEAGRNHHVEPGDTVKQLQLEDHPTYIERLLRAGGTPDTAAARG